MLKKKSFKGKKKGPTCGTEIRVLYAIIFSSLFSFICMLGSVAWGFQQCGHPQVKIIVTFFTLPFTFSPYLLYQARSC